MDSLEENQHLIAQAMLADQHWLRDQWARLREPEGSAKANDRQFSLFAERLHASVARRLRRQRHVPAVAFDNDLPVTARREEIVAAIRQHQVLVVAGETGSGKSTQLPKICLEAGYGVAGLIGHTQPRRIAARSIAARVAEELGTPLGQAVGYKVRFQDNTSPNTFIKLMTDGILLAEAASDRFLEQYEVIILDEAHERSLNVDFLLGILAGLLRKRRDLRLIVTSATIDVQRFSEHFGTADAAAPVIQVEGRTHPVEVRYRELNDEQGRAIDPFSGILNAVHELGHGDDILIFLPTERDIREAAKRLRADQLLQRRGNTEILPLYARLSTAEQNKIFHPGTARRIVLATNVAESSLTVPRIHAVVDTGTARMSRYSPRLRMQRLPIEPVSQASANQRTGRCGRLGPGVCIRLYSADDFSSRSAFTTPEIRRTNLASVILQAKHLKLGELDQIPLLDPPRSESIREGYKTLRELGAVDEQRRLTKTGRTLACWPVDPRIARMILAADKEGCLAELLIIAAALEVQDPRLRPLDHQQAADEQHARFTDENSDFLSFLRLWDYVETQRQSLSRGRFQKACQHQFLSIARLREWGEIHRQLKQTVIEHGLRPQERKADSPAIHRALLTGLLSCVAVRSDDHEYTGAGGVKFQLWPGSGLLPSRPKWVMAAELVETGRRYGRTVAKIDPNWLESLGAHLVKRSYSDPHWHEKSLTVMAFERVTMLGLPVVARRRVRYGPIDPEVSRELFIEHGLVEQRMAVDDHFFRHNQAVLQAAAELAAKTRLRDYILDEYRVHGFYAERIPHEVFDMVSLRRKLQQDKALADSLCMSLEELVSSGEDPEQQGFPQWLHVGEMQLPLSYHFEPGADDDGVTVTVPVEALPQLQPRQLEWLIPGLLEEKLVALIRSLPKTIRRGLVPAPETARRVAKSLEYGVGSLAQQVAERFSEICGERISPRDFRLEKLPDHLRMRIQVVDAEGKTQLASRDLTKLSEPSGEAAGRNVVESSDTMVPGEWHRDEISSWDFGDLPPEVRVQRGAIEVVLFPAVVDQIQHVGLRLLDTRQAASGETRRGLCRLYQLANQRELRAQVRWLPRWEEICLWSATLCSKAVLEGQLQMLLAERAFLADAIPRSEAEFNARQVESGQRIAVATQQVAGVLPQLMETYHLVQVALERLNSGKFAAAKAQMVTQIAELLPADFSLVTPWEWFVHLPRYLAAIAHRIDKLTSGGQARDRDNQLEMDSLWSRYLECRRRAANSTNNDLLVEYRWMLEEYRVSLFAQALGTAIKVSPQRLQKQWEKIHA